LGRQTERSWISDHQIPRRVGIQRGYAGGYAWGFRIPQKCTTFDMTRQFLVDHVQRIIYLRDKVTLIGSVPVRRGTFQAPIPVPFQIAGEPD
jgi:hypothetical protein